MRRQSLYEQLGARQGIAFEPEPESEPGFPVRLARFCWRNALWIILFWTLIGAASTYGLVRSFILPVDSPMPLPVRDVEMQELASAFPAIENLQTITLSGSDTAKLHAQRDELVSVLRQRASDFEVVFAPGAGDYYDRYGLLYRPLPEIRSRVAYALSLKPLFSAIAEAPNANSMATLVDETAAAIEQDREPQGLEDLFVESAESIEALMSGSDQPVDWSKIASLESEDVGSEVTVLALPRKGQEQSARSATLKLLDGIKTSSTTKAELQQATIQETARTALPFDHARAHAGAFIGWVFSFLIIALGLGGLRLAVVVLSPILLTVSLASFVMFRLSGPDWGSFWAAVAAVGLATAQLSLAQAANLNALSPESQASELQVVNAAEVHAPSLMWQAAIAASFWLGLLSLHDKFFLLVGISFFSLVLIGWSCVFTLGPALFKVLPEAQKWRAGDWLRPAHRALFENRPWRFIATGLCMGLVVASLLALFKVPVVRAPEPAEGPVNVIVASQAEARKSVLALKTLPQAASVRWIGMFVPEGAEPKRQLLQALRNQFSRITPVTPEAPEDLRDQLDELQDSLKNIATASGTKPELKNAADRLQRSIALVAATASDQQLLQIENRLFGGFNRLADRADILSALDAPTLETLPPELRELFVSNTGNFRLEVVPARGVSNAALSFLLRDTGFPVVHPAAEARDTLRARMGDVIWTLGLGFGLACLLFLASTGISADLIGPAIILAVTIFVLMGAERLWQADWNVPRLITVLAVLSYLFSTAARFSRPAPDAAMRAVEVLIWPAIAMSAALPFLLLGVDALTQDIFPLAAGLALVAMVAVLLHGAQFNEVAAKGSE